MLKNYRGRKLLALITLSSQDIISNLKPSYKNLRDHQSNHKQLCETHLDSLAEAIVLAQSPSVQHGSVAHITGERNLR
jgi:hypothetical protein